MAQREEAATDTWKRTITGIPTVLGRLAYLASLRDSSRDIYHHFGLAQRIGESETDAILRNSHVGVFQEWLCFGLEKQKDEAEEYLSSLEGDRREVVANWLALEPWLTWVPPSSRDVERSLFASDLRAVMELLRADYGVASRDPDS